jgi:hypothetical protein
MTFFGGSVSQLVCGLHLAFKSGSAPAVMFGDSGGPVYKIPATGGASIYGIINGVSLANLSIFIYTRVQQVREFYGGAPLAG